MQELKTQIAKYSAVGIINTLLTIAVIAALSFVGVPSLLANSVGFGCGLASSFILNPRFTFVSAQKGQFLCISSRLWCGIRNERARIATFNDSPDHKCDDPSAHRNLDLQCSIFHSHEVIGFSLL
jgi:hypothetical protein